MYLMVITSVTNNCMMRVYKVGISRSHGPPVYFFPMAPLHGIMGDKACLWPTPLRDPRYATGLARSPLSVRGSGRGLT